MILLLCPNKTNQTMRGSRRNLTSSSAGSGANNNTNKKKLGECCYYSRVYKRTRTKQQNVIRKDLISNLPDHILHHIFTFLDTKQAIQTCILSRRWRYFWVSLPTLKFTYTYHNGRCTKPNRNKFMDFVDRVLMIRDNSNIHEFVLDTDFDYIDVTDRLNTWILVCVLRNVQQLILETFLPENFQLHHCLLTCKSLTKLVVKPVYRRVSLSLPDSVTLPRLKTLSLHLVKFKDEDSANQLISSCPILESLVIKNCLFPRININISSYQLQHLVIENCRTRDTLVPKPINYNDIKFKLCAPNLISLIYCNDSMSACCDLKNLCSLVKAQINIYIDSEWSKKEKAMYAQRMVNILRKLHNVEDLTLSASFLEVISEDPDLFDRQPTKFGNLRCLKLEGEWHSIDYIHGISYLLKISPNIETLSIDVEEFYDSLEDATDLLDVQPTQFCNLRCLKMHTLFSRDWIDVIACLLKICPNTETLSHRIYHENVDIPDDPSNDEMDEMNPYWDEMTSDPTINRYFGEARLPLECLLNNLKCFELCDVTGRINELEFLQILLKNTMLLEKLLIIFRKPYSVDVDEEIRRVKFSEKVLTFPRASSSVVILFK